MKRITISLVSVVVVAALFLGVLPAAAAEPLGGTVAGSDYPGEGLYSVNTLEEADYSAADAVPGGSPATESDDPPLTIRVGEPLTFTISAADPNDDPLIYSASNLPPGATFDPGTRTFSWTPGYDQAGIYRNVRFEVSDGQLSDAEEITITVINVDRTPALDGIGDKSVNEGELINFVINATDPDGDPLTYTASNLPLGAAFDPGTRTFSWTPGFGQRGTYSGIHFEVSDGELTDFENITITVTASGDDQMPPEISGVAASEVTASSADIFWLTNEPSTSQVEYWASPSKLTALDGNIVFSHLVKLTGLSPGTTYNFKVISTDSAGNLAEYYGGTFTTPEGGAFSVDSLRINPSKAATGRDVNIRVFVTNGGTVTGSHEVTLRINGIIEDSRVVTVAAGVTEEVRFVTSRYVAGTYIVNVNGLSGSFLVREESKNKSPGRGRNKSYNSVLSEAFGWIRTALSQGGDA